MRFFKNKCIRFFIICLLQVGISACEWPSYVKLAVTSFADDPGFDRNADSNKIQQLSSLSYYWDDTAVTLQCLNGAGNWINIGVGSVSKNSDGTLLNFNSKYPDKPVYGHTWSGSSIIQAVAYCRVTKMLISTLKTNDWTYSHYQKSLTLRAVASNGFVIPNYSDTERACWGNDPSPDYWQRHNDCNNQSNDVSYLQSVDEEIVRNSNFTQVRVDLNSGSQDIYNCDLDVKMDDVDYGVFYYKTTTSPLYFKLKQGADHHLQVAVQGCILKLNNFTGQPACPYISLGGTPVPNPTGANCPENTETVYVPHGVYSWQIKAGQIGTPQTFTIYSSALAP